MDAPRGIHFLAPDLECIYKCDLYAGWFIIWNTYAFYNICNDLFYTFSGKSVYKMEFVFVNLEISCYNKN